MLFLLDTNAVRDAMNQHPHILRRIASMRGVHRVAVPVIVRGEVLYGIERIPRGKRREALSHQASAVLAAVGSEAVPVAAAELYGNLKVAREQQGLPMAENDLWIAATALALPAVLVTRDGDFANITDLRVEDWTS